MLDFMGLLMCKKGPHLLPFDFEGGVSERLAVLVDLLDDPLVVHHRGVIIPQ